MGTSCCVHGCPRACSTWVNRARHVVVTAEIVTSILGSRHAFRWWRSAGNSTAYPQQLYCVEVSSARVGDTNNKEMTGEADALLACWAGERGWRCAGRRCHSSLSHTAPYLVLHVSKAGLCKAAVVDGKMRSPPTYWPGHGAEHEGERFSCSYSNISCQISKRLVSLYHRYM